MSDRALLSAEPLSSITRFDRLPVLAQIRAILALAWPMVFGMLSQNLLNLVDMYMVGGLGRTAIAAQALGGMTVFVFVGGLGALSVGTQTYVARRFGQGRHAECGAVLDNTLIMATVIGVAILLPCFAFTPQVLSFFASDPEVIALGTPYMRYRYLGVLLFVYLMAFRGFFNGIGETKIYLTASWAMNVFNILANYCLIYGHCGFPALGLTGAGIGTAVANIVGAGIFVARSLKLHYRDTYQVWRIANLQWPLARDIFWMSLPPAIEGTIIVSSYSFLMMFTGMVGTAHQAAAGITMTCFAFVYLPAVGLGQAGGGLVGRQLGARNLESALSSARQLLRVAVGLSFLTGLIFAQWGAQIFGFFTGDREVIAIGQGTLAILSLFVIIDAVSIVLGYILQAAGLTRYVMMVHIGACLVIFIPGAYIFSYVLEGGTAGGFLAFGAYISAYFALLAWAFWRGEWLHHEF